MRANDDGTQVAEVLSHNSVIAAFDIDIVGRKLYWTGMPSGRAIYRSNVDGTQIERLLERQSSIDGLTIDTDLGRMFWFEHASEEIFTAKLDGSDVQIQFGSQTDKAQSLAVDPVGGCLYFTQGDGVKRGSIVVGASCDPSLVVRRSPDAFTQRIVLDVPNEWLYWSETDNTLPTAEGSGSIRRIGFDGTNMQTIVASPPDPDTGFRIMGVALDLVRQRVYWTEWGYDGLTFARIRRANLDCANIEDLHIAGLSQPDTIVFDPIPEPAPVALAAIVIVVGAARYWRTAPSMAATSPAVVYSTASTVGE